MCSAIQCSAYLSVFFCKIRSNLDGAFAAVSSSQKAGTRSFFASLNALW